MSGTPRSEIRTEQGWRALDRVSLFFTVVLAAALFWLWPGHADDDKAPASIQATDAPASATTPTVIARTDQASDSGDPVATTSGQPDRQVTASTPTTTGKPNPVSTTDSGTGSGTDGTDDSTADRASDSQQAAGSNEQTPPARTSSAAASADDTSPVETAADTTDNNMTATTGADTRDPAADNTPAASETENTGDTASDAPASASVSETKTETETETEASTPAAVPADATGASRPATTAPETSTATTGAPLTPGGNGEPRQPTEPATGSSAVTTTTASRNPAAGTSTETTVATEPNGSSPNVARSETARSNRYCRTLQRGAPVRLAFGTASTRLSSTTRQRLDDIAQCMKQNRSTRYLVGGHTDNRGNRVDNLLLSVERARVARDYLVRAGVRAAQVEYRGFGDTQPAGDNWTARGRALNRRIEISPL